MSFSVLSLNARGLRDLVKCKALFLFSRQFGSDFVFFQESHSNDKDVNFWKSQWGREIWFSHGSEHSAGVSCLKIILQVMCCTHTVMSMGTLFC